MYPRRALAALLPVCRRAVGARLVSHFACASAARAVPGPYYASVIQAQPTLHARGRRLARPLPVRSIARICRRNPAFYKHMAQARHYLNLRLQQAIVAGQ